MTNLDVPNQDGLGIEALEVNSKLNSLKIICEDLDCSLAQLAIAWCLRLENNSCVLVGASNPEQIKENLGAIDVMKRLSVMDLQRIDEILNNSPMRRESVSGVRPSVMRPRGYSINK